MSTRRHGLRDDQWDRIKDLLPGCEGHVNGTAKDNSLLVDAVLYRYRAGIPWRELPGRFGDFRVVQRGSAVGRRAGCGKRFSRNWPAMPTTNMPCSTARSCGRTSTARER